MLVEDVTKFLETWPVRLFQVTRHEANIFEAIFLSNGVHTTVRLRWHRGDSRARLEVASVPGWRPFAEGIGMALYLGSTNQMAEARAEAEGSMT